MIPLNQNEKLFSGLSYVHNLAPMTSAFVRGFSPLWTSSTTYTPGAPLALVDHLFSVTCEAHSFSVQPISDPKALHWLVLFIQ